MSMRVSAAAMWEIQKLFGLGVMGAWTDSQLIDGFLSGQEESEAAFRVLIHRHGPMVLGVCRRVLGDEHAAEDAFQATFLVFVKKAGMLRDRGLLTNWLYGVAWKVSHKERARGQRRKAVERQAAEQAPRLADDPESGELRSLIDEEIRRLPERYRMPLLLCHVEGLRHDEVARRLGCPVGTVESRLARARERLRSRLARRGLAPTAAALGPMLGTPMVSPVRSSLVESTLRAGLRNLDTETPLLIAARALLGRLGRTAAGVSLGARTAAVAMVICTAIAAAGLGLFRIEEPRPSPSPRPTPAAPVAAARPASIEPTESRRTPQAVARPISGITIDGRLDDWPEGLQKYPIRQVLTSQPGAYRKAIGGPRDVEAHFMAGYDATVGLIYIAVVVHDDDPVLNRSSTPLNNDAVEVYVDGWFSERQMDEPVSGDWKAVLDAARMPVLQYVGLAGEVPAYGDRFGKNPALMYASIREPRTRMKYRRQGRVTTYEWAVRVYDRFPERATRLGPGKRIGLEIAVVDKDSGPTKPAFLTWGSPPSVFKGFDAGSLGELFLAGGP
jgi:RNA polymerase sigma factor (sigma-70 family)